MAAIPLRTEIFYPESDGKPMAETGLHVAELMKLLSLLKHHFRHHADVYVTANMFLYFVEGDPRSVVAPDLYVARGVAGNHERRTWQVWREGVPPCFVLEVTSDSTRRVDLYKKKDVYARIGVAEYFLFDLLGDYLKPALQGFQLVDGSYRPMASLFDGALVSQTLGITFRPTPADGLRLFEAATGRPLLGLSEMHDRLDEMRSELAAAEAKRTEAEAKVTVLEAELRRQRLYRQEDDARMSAFEERLARLEGR